MMSLPKKPPRPASVIITQILMLINLVPIALGLVFIFVRTLITAPSNLISIRAGLFFAIAFGSIIFFLGYGFAGLVKGKKIGYWLGLTFVALGIAANIYVLIPSLYIVMTSSDPSVYRLLKYHSQSLMTVDLVVQTVVFLLLAALFLKLLLGKKEKLFFS